MPNEFDDLFEYLVPTGTVRFTLSKVFVRSDKPLVLVMKHAGEENGAYKSARAKASAELTAARRRGDDTEASAINLRLFAATVIEGWENANGADGSPLPFSVSKCADLLAVLWKKAPDEVAAAMSYAYNADNFRGSPTAAAEALGK